MLKILFRTLTLLFVFQSMAQSSESGGMPQLNPEFWVSQIFWLTLTFGILFIVLSKFILPKISTNLETRKSQILENIDSAKKIIEESKKKLDSDINEKKNKFNEEMEKELLVIEKEIKTLKKSSISSVGKIASDISGEIVKQIVNTEVNKSNVDAIVNDVIKRRQSKLI